MKKLTPSVKAVVASTLVLTSTAAIAYAVPGMINDKNADIGDKLKLQVERVDNDTVKVAIDNVKDIPKSLQFSIKLDGVVLQDGQNSIKDLVEKEVQTRLNNNGYSTNSNSVLTDYTYNKSENTIDVLITSENSLPKVGNKIEIFELDVKKTSRNTTGTYKVLPNNEGDYKYVSSSNKEYDNLGVVHDNKEISMAVAPTIESIERHLTITEGEVVTAEKLKDALGLKLNHEDGTNGLELEVLRDGKVITEFSENTPGIYELELKAVKDKNLKSEGIKIQINVVLDNVTEPPTITINGEDLDNITLDGGSVFKPLENVKAVDKKGRNVKVDVKVDKDLDLDPDQDTEYKLIYTATDIYGNTATKEVTLKVVANQAPVISGVKDRTISVGDKFNPRDGVIVKDDKDNDIVLNVESEVNTNIPGKYKVSYSATDSGGKTTRVQSTVTVNPKPGIINKVPVITASDRNIVVGTEFDPLEGVTAFDEEDKDLTKAIKVVKNDVDSSTVGKYKVVYQVTDSGGAKVTKEITVTVLKKLVEINHPPQIRATDKIVKLGSKFDPKENIVAYDREDLDITHKLEVIENTVDTSVVGDYTVKYRVTDSGGATTTKVITVTVKSDVVLATDITINNKGDNKVYVGGSKTINAAVNKEAELKDIDWKISDSSIAELKVVRNEARIIAKAKGKVTLTALTTDGSNLSDTITIHVSNFEDDSEIPLHVKDVIDTNVLTPMSGLGVKEFPLEFEVKDVTVDKLDKFIADLESLDYQVISIHEDDEFTIYQIRVAKKSGLFKSTEDTFINIKVSKALKNADEINDRLGELSDNRTEKPGTSEENKEEKPGTSEENKEEKPGKSEENKEEKPGTPEENKGEKPGKSEENISNPETGDTGIAGYIGIAVAAVAAVGGLVLNKRKKK